MSSDINDDIADWVIRPPEFDHGVDITSQRKHRLNDGLDRRSLARLLAKHLLGPECGVVGVYGTWGSGKSFVLDLTIEELFERDSGCHPIVCHFRPWQFEPDTSLAPGLIMALESVSSQFPTLNPRLEDSAVTRVSELGRHLRKIMRTTVGWVNQVAHAANVGLAVTPPILPYQATAEATAAVIETTTAIAGAMLSGKESVAITEFETWDPPGIRSKMTQLITELRTAAARTSDGKADDYRVIVVIDDLDRCAPDLMVDMLNWLKVHLTVEGCSYLLALDHGAAARAIIGRYRDYLGDSADIAYGLRYLEKIVDFEIELGESELVERMAAQAVEFGAAGSVVEIVERELGRQGVRSAEMQQFMRLSVLQSPRTMLKVIFRFVLALREVHAQQEERIKGPSGGAQLPADYAFWLLLLVGMYYRLAPSEIESFCHGRGPLVEEEDYNASTARRAAEPLIEFRRFIGQVAGEGGEKRPQPGAAVLMELYSAVRQLAVP